MAIREEGDPDDNLSVNNRHPHPVLQPQPHFRHGNPLPLDHWATRHNLHGHPYTLPSGGGKVVGINTS